MKKAVTISITFIIVIFLWQVFLGSVDRYRIQNNETPLSVFVASPHSIAEVFTQNGSLIVSELGYTLARAGAGLILGIVLALAMSLLFLIIPSIRNSLFPISFAINSFPIVGFAPVIILAFGQGSWFSIVFISMLISYFPLLVGFDNAFKNVEKEILEVMKVFNSSTRQLVLKIYLPSAIPSFLTSLRLAIPASIIGATIGEWLGTRNGIGQLITVSMYQLKPALLYASLLSVTLVSILLIGSLTLIEKKFLKWKK